MDNLSVRLKGLRRAAAKHIHQAHRRKRTPPAQPHSPPPTTQELEHFVDMAGWNGNARERFMAMSAAQQRSLMKAGKEHMTRNDADEWAEKIQCLDKSQVKRSMASLRSVVNISGKKWMQTFVELQGLLSICQCMEIVDDNSSALMSCLLCFSSFLYTKVGFRAIAGDKATAETVGHQLVCSFYKGTIEVKKYVIKMLSVMVKLMFHNEYRGVDIVAAFRSLKRKEDLTGSAFSPLMDYLDVYQQDFEYSVGSIVLINCMINYTDGLEERVEIRREFIDLGIEDLLKELRVRHSEEETSDLDRQVELFYKLKHMDDLETQLDGIDLTDTESVFKSLQRICYHQMHSDKLLEMLQYLLIIPSKQSYAVWESSLSAMRHLFQLKDRVTYEELRQRLLNINDFEMKVIPNWDNFHEKEKYNDVSELKVDHVRLRKI